MKQTKQVTIVHSVIAYLNGHTPTNLVTGSTHALPMQLADSLVAGGFARYVADAPSREHGTQPQGTAQRIALVAAQQRRNRGVKR